ncbi:hypothetical protein GGR55DRAFT_276777 [Xylaria sp. FL0064]|nr:hypothetical protein GGR55DRAFT_276777 [Xylaria sp. FL0064]
MYIVHVGTTLCRQIIRARSWGTGTLLLLLLLMIRCVQCSASQLHIVLALVQFDGWGVQPYTVSFSSPTYLGSLVQSVFDGTLGLERKSLHGIPIRLFVLFCNIAWPALGSPFLLTYVPRICSSTLLPKLKESIDSFLTIPLDPGYS